MVSEEVDYAWLLKFVVCCCNLATFREGTVAKLWAAFLFYEWSGLYRLHSFVVLAQHVLRSEHDKVALHVVYVSQYGRARVMR